jgi:hypothetical protein
MSFQTVKEYLDSRRPFSRQRVIDHVEDWGAFDSIEVSPIGLITVSLTDDLWLEVEDSEIAPEGCTNRFESMVEYELCRTCGGRGGVTIPGYKEVSTLMHHGKELVCGDCQGQRVKVKVQPVPDWLDQWITNQQELHAYLAYEDSYVRSRGG